MKKKVLIVISVLTILCPIVFYGCGKVALTQYISELRYDILTGENDLYKLKAYLYESEQPLIEDGIVGEKKFFVRFYLYGEDTENFTFKVKFTLDKEYDRTFTLNGFNGTLSCEIQTSKISSSKLDVTLSKGSDVYNIALSSAIPSGTINVYQTLAVIEKEQSALINNFSDSAGEFSAEISARILIKNDKPYWYVAFITSLNKKAFLVDGNGNILAIRDVFS